jgi:hypothetical protein
MVAGVLDPAAAERALGVERRFMEPSSGTAFV